MIHVTLMPHASSYFRHIVWFLWVKKRMRVRIRYEKRQKKTRGLIGIDEERVP